MALQPPQTATGQITNIYEVNHRKGERGSFTSQRFTVSSNEYGPILLTANGKGEDFLFAYKIKDEVIVTFNSKDEFWNNQNKTVNYVNTIEFIDSKKNTPEYKSKLKDALRVKNYNKLKSLYPQPAFITITANEYNTFLYNLPIKKEFEVSNKIMETIFKHPDKIIESRPQLDSIIEQIFKKIESGGNKSTSLPSASSLLFTAVNKCVNELGIEKTKITFNELISKIAELTNSKSAIETFETKKEIPDPQKVIIDNLPF